MKKKRRRREKIKRNKEKGRVHGGAGGKSANYTTTPRIGYRS